MRFPIITRGHCRRLTMLAAAGVLALGLGACSSDDAEDVGAGRGIRFENDEDTEN